MTWVRTSLVTAATGWGYSTLTVRSTVTVSVSTSAAARAGASSPTDHGSRRESPVWTTPPTPSTSDAARVAIFSTTRGPMIVSPRLVTRGDLGSSAVAGVLNGGSSRRPRGTA